MNKPGYFSDMTVMIVDDHRIFRDGLRMLLRKLPFISEIYEASNGQEFLDSLKERQPDIVLMDINMPVMNGIEATKQALEQYPGLKIIALTTFLDEDYIDNMLMAGVEGYMLKRSEFEEFEKALLKVAGGGSYFADEILKHIAANLKNLRTQMAGQQEADSFTEREKEILGLICQGFNNEQIAEMTFLSPKTIEKHKSNLFEKTGTVNTVNLVIYAFRNRLVEL